MYADMTTPRARHWAMPAFVAMVFAIVTRYTFAPASMWNLIGYSAALVFAAWSLVNFIHHFGNALSATLREWKEVEFRLSENYRVERLATMTPEQLKAVRAGKAIFELIPGETVRVDKLFGYEAYERILWFILVNSNSERVYPINNFQTGTFHFDDIGDHAIDDNRQAHNVHAWLVWYGFAEWGRGNQSASWVKPYNPDKVLEMLNMTRDTYQDK